MSTFSFTLGLGEPDIDPEIELRLWYSAAFALTFACISGEFTGVMVPEFIVAAPFAHTSPQHFGMQRVETKFHFKHLAPSVFHSSTYRLSMVALSMRLVSKFARKF